MLTYRLNFAALESGMTQRATNDSQPEKLADAVIHLVGVAASVAAVTTTPTPANVIAMGAILG